jgi:hypothetical protein
MLSSQLGLDGNVWVPVADSRRSDPDPSILHVPARALGSLSGQRTRRFHCALELLEQVERGFWNEDHKLSFQIVRVDLGHRIKELGALRRLIRDYEVISHSSSR